MNWVLLSLIAAVCVSTADALTKKLFGALGAYEMGLARTTYSVPLLLLALFFIPWPSLDRAFFTSILIALPLEVTAFILYMKAIKASPLSLTLPFLAFTPLFIIITGWVVLGEAVSIPGLAGILLIVSGAYVLNLSHVRGGLIAPVRAVFREKGSRLMLAVSFIYSITSVLGKRGVIHSDPFFFGVVYYVSFPLPLLPSPPAVKEARLSNIAKKPAAGMVIGVLTALEIFSHLKALSMVQTAYMISVKRTSLLFGVLYGALLFHEERITERLAGALIMLAGVFLIGWFG
jgi:drug/metabolite transporter (DMT)-like permease